MTPHARGKSLDFLLMHNVFSVLIILSTINVKRYQEINFVQST